ncbi:AcrR family transcriptional regulator [Mycolicibacterium sp. BK556]|uniref:TetR/AcrR family transcriptional regulator n=1 Tax=Mycobacteriaceae TaxID=1762 RepID=UPI00105E647C|nr:MULTISPECIES: TetR/AcrR family transcriptional regulator [Mycobacteriaceae]MBB3605920.1 AcrR family transcriptional regulator [Mycolicibacterium sp. BK556]MBB3632497.1 AcrR family transcriptional regulator [Mycolicibacterium sp. BK607]MBB3753893.1 AcrR family transcriptional regulator [Mycolicibacterium sp. BK634]TDO18214.1 TetR family transcriptional regulator [Mycobacterium sp. BK086]
MASTAKTKEKDAGARERLMEATAQIMLEEGYAAATSRRVAARAGVRSALVYYYFPTMDDLFVAVLRSGSDASLGRMRQAITADEPLRALWSINTDPRWTGLYTEFVALANHRKVISAELKAYAERVRDIETAAATVALRAHGFDISEYPPVAVSMLVAQIARSLCNESAIGMTEGHEEMRELVDRFLNRFASTEQAKAT